MRMGGGREGGTQLHELGTGEGWMGEFQGSGVQQQDINIGILILSPSSLKLLYFFEERTVETVTGADQSLGVALPISLLGLLLSFLQAGSSVFLGN